MRNRYFFAALFVGLSALAFQSPKVQQSKIDALYNAMNDTHRVGQMIMMAAGGLGYTVEGQQLHELARKGMLGGIIFLGGESSDYLAIHEAFSVYAKPLPLMYATDAEPALIPGKVRDIKSFPATSSINSVEECMQVVSDLDTILHNLHITINFAPVCDVTQANEAIGKRSFGNDPDKIVELASAFCVQSLNDDILPVVKHFPGHGFVKGDSHKKLVYIDGEMQELEVFSAMIERGAPAIMVGHIAVQNNAFATNGLPSTCSRNIVHDLLRDSLQFDGLVFTDAMNMGAVKAIPQSGLLAAKAGCDVILMPENPEKVVMSILQEMKNDPAFAKQIEASVKRIIAHKLQYVAEGL